MGCRGREAFDGEGVDEDAERRADLRRAKVNGEVVLVARRLGSSKLTERTKRQSLLHTIWQTGSDDDELANAFKVYGLLCKEVYITHPLHQFFVPILHHRKMKRI